ncbi:hypothetical protein K491DRAFT_492290 [Lophiostoma macrostomum CBS 122681]|uniref:Uncharacterized protein n=1 Tax=Lophiostoma macrostomum CBS 122681 TaxID=1314788 RepID=A0A6A6T5B4_9PLEO|nr:hypothetical protein K491DRAFT_492290 [Lophiostoma macrostomum CBS 122681]
MPPQPNPYFSTILNPAPSNPSPPPPTTTPSAIDPTSTTCTPPRPSPSISTTKRPLPSFTSTQQSLQARAKPFTSLSPSATLSNESYESRQRRHNAANILDSVELLIWYSGARNESIAQTRTHYQNVLLGLSDEGERLWREEWDVPVEERVRREGRGVGREFEVMWVGLGEEPGRRLFGVRCVDEDGLRYSGVVYEMCWRVDSRMDSRTVYGARSLI